MQWRTRSTSSGQCTLQGLIAWLSADGVNQAFVADRLQSLPVRVVRPVGKPPYICATAEDGSTDALLALPRF